MYTSPWHTDDSDFPAGGRVADKLRFVVNYAILAPSGHNTQPWLFRLTEDRLELYADRRRGLPVVDPRDRELTISCGAALGHLETALRRFGHAGALALLPEPNDPDLLATASLGPAHVPDGEDEALFAAIPRRRTTRLPFDQTPLPDDLAARLVAAAAAHGVRLHLFTDAADRHRLADLVARGDRIQFADPRFRRELAAWIHSRRAASRDGMSFESFGGLDILSWAGAAVVRTFDLGKGTAAKDAQVAAHSPTLAILATGADEPVDWLSAGRALSRVLLTATAAGVTAAYLNQPIEVAELRDSVREAMGLDDVPQLLLRLGRGPDVPPAARRPVAEVMIA